MDVFSFCKDVVAEYERFSRSFTLIRAKDISQDIDKSYKGGQFWPEPMIQLNPNFVTGGSIEDLVSEDTLDAECRKIFRIKKSKDSDGELLVLHKHQSEAIHIARRGESYVLTTGTGSGKSLGYFIPIVDDVLRRKKSGDPCGGISAIVVYPMNALCNSQHEELEKFLKLGYGDGKEPVTFARYTGQESNDERDQIAKNPPDILLTNYVMLELIMTRFLGTDTAVRKHASGLRFLVLDELHTYRGRQGADVAMLVRRVRERFNENLLCVGTSATMASEGSIEERNKIVAGVASRLFGVPVSPGNIVSETLKRVTDKDVSVNRTKLRISIEEGVPKNPTHGELSRHPVASWIEQELGLKESPDGRLVRTPRPLTILEAAETLAETSGLEIKDCLEYLKNFLLAACQSLNEKGQAFFAFRLHQFISGAWNAYSTLEVPGNRFITLKGQRFKPGNRKHLLFNLSFCRQCGQEYFPVWATTTADHLEKFTPRDLSERSSEDEDARYGYLMPDNEGKFDPSVPENHYPEDWLEPRGGSQRLKSPYKRYSPANIKVDTLGAVADEGLSAWFIPGSFRFCLNQDCDARYDGRTSDLSKLSGLSSEGRSSATTVLVLSSLRHLIGTDLDERTKKILAFTDNRQDASLQAGHFNDLVQVLLLRSSLLAAIKSTPDGKLTDDVLTQVVLDHLRLDPTDYADNPGSKGAKARNTLRTLRDVLGYRLYFDLQRGWRITNPNLEQLNLLEIRYGELMDCCEDEEEWAGKHPLLLSMDPETRFEIIHDLLDRMRKALCIKTIYLDPNFQDQVRNRSYNELKEPWGIQEEERLSPHAFMVPRSGSKSRRHAHRTLNVSHRSAFGRKLRFLILPREGEPRMKFDEDVYNAVIDDILDVLTTYGLVEPSPLDGGLVGYRIDSSVLEWRLSEPTNADTGIPPNLFFRDLYRNIAGLLEEDDCFLRQLEAREHTAQVDHEIREEREARFRKGLEGESHADGRNEPAGLPVLFCSPTMELGVDISTLNTVYMRNVPPTPANYAQRSGRAGRSGQPALVITYCAAQSPHDQYFFSDPARMVAGIVNPPTIDLANEDLVRSHLHSVWLAETGVNLGRSVSEVLNMEETDELPLHDHLALQIGSKKAVDETEKRAGNILSTLKENLSEQSAPWYTKTWLEAAVKSAEHRFNEAFQRWRSLYRATSSQMKAANEVLNVNAATTAKERREAKSRYDEAFHQQNLLLDMKSRINSDFYTYRYLAAEGFLPGYNFPRLPLMAFIPGRRQKVVRELFLSRPRFLGLSEFGPQSIIYHEGSTYRVRRAILAIRDEEDVTTSSKLPVRAVRTCPACGYGHFGDQKDFERCVNCDCLLKDGRFIPTLYRIEQVSTQRANRITSDEEERQRQGYEMITTFRFAQEDGRPRISGTTFEEKGETLLDIRYGPAATLWRVNLGWRRRKEKSVYGFSIDVTTGEWTKDSQAPTDAEDDRVGQGTSVIRITPFVEDTKNILVVRPETELSTKAMISLQYALKRGIEQEFQLEESELAAEPLPDRGNRTAILFYEAAEGGAGTLTRLVNDPGAISRVARKALRTCHYASEDWTGFKDLKDKDPECEAGCYRCLLSYYNQPDHPQIDRRDEVMLDFLCRLARSERRVSEHPSTSGDSFEELMNAAGSSLEEEWLVHLKTNGYRLPNRVQHYIEEHKTRPDFAYAESNVLIYIDGPHHEGDAQKTLDARITRDLENGGFTVVRFSADRTSWKSIMNEYAWIFGPGGPPEDQ